ncbi:MAG: hypothetical protein ABW049_08080 [Spongiibacteraceae bacterium]
MNGESHKLSTSALAKQLDIPLQQLFGTLRDYGWIRKLEDGWALTPKGEFEGGEYVHSKRYGRYIVWPEALPEHPLLQGMAENRLLNAAQLGRKYGLHAREVRRLLGEIGLLRRGVNGWELSVHGEQLGGVLMENEGHDGDVSWPEALLTHELFSAQLEYGQRLYRDTENDEGDLLALVSDYESLDGHHFCNRGTWQICSWLYLAGIVHACHRRLPWHEPLFADFWLPESGLYLEYSGDEHDSASLTASLQRLDIYRQQQWPVIEVRAEQLADLDDVLTRELRRRGVRVW